MLLAMLARGVWFMATVITEMLRGGSSSKSML
jgi:hypothetical protein